MVPLTSLWLVILASAAITVVAGTIICMALPIHRKDYKPLGDKEPGMLAAIKAAALAPGVYMFPWYRPGSDADKEAHAERERTGPWGLLTVSKSAPSMGRMMGLWFVHLLVISAFVAYVARHSIAPGTHYLGVFRVAGAAAFLAHFGGAMPSCIWHGRPWSAFPGMVFDAIVYSLLTAGTFGWLWPK